MIYQIGAAKAGITAFKRGVGMMGYGLFHQFVEEVETPLFARAVVIKTGRGKVAWVNAEICFITLAIRTAVMEKIGGLGFTEDAVMLTAQHTHSGPGGYSHYALYNMSIPGFGPEVFQIIVDGIVEVIIQADANARPAVIKFSSGEFPLDRDVAFNRSLAAYNRNPEVVKVTEKDANAAIDRQMLLFRFDGVDGTPIATWNFFGVHCTSISNDQHRICADNKGHAAALMEEHEGVAVFAQRSAGDVTPNFIFDRKKGWTRGSHEDDFESSRINGRLQFEQARELSARAAISEVLPVEIDSLLAWVDFTKVSIDAEFSRGETDARTGPACHGVAFARGTREGPGMPKILADVSVLLSRALKAWELFSMRWKPVAEAVRLKYRIQDPKDILFEAGQRRILGFRDIRKLPLPGWADGGLAAFKRFYANGSLGDQPWIPQVLPLQLMIVGDCAFAAVPGEVTTIAGRRIEKSLLEILSTRGIEEVVVASYANGYCGYVTTLEEYEEQAYEGGHTVFGKHTLGAVQTRFKGMALEMLKPVAERRNLSDGLPPDFSGGEIALRSFDARFR
ncbi:MAG: neutral/alkaline non-lysosomal ceramidase N-terminal domain-containing protein [Verrucomicrobiota bacterium]